MIGRLEYAPGHRALRRSVITLEDRPWSQTPQTGEVIRSCQLPPMIGVWSVPMGTQVPEYNVRLKRAYEPPSADDGSRILVDRLWPCAISKHALALNEWMKDIAPSTELRHWFGHDPSRWHEFCRRYAAEVHEHQGLLEELRARARKGRITLVFSARDGMHNDAVALKSFILRGLPGRGTVKEQKK